MPAAMQAHVLAYDQGRSNEEQEQSLAMLKSMAGGSAKSGAKRRG